MLLLYYAHYFSLTMNIVLYYFYVGYTICYKQKEKNIDKELSPWYCNPFISDDTILQISVYQNFCGVFVHSLLIILKHSTTQFTKLYEQSIMHLPLLIKSYNTTIITFILLFVIISNPYCILNQSMIYIFIIKQMKSYICLEEYGT